MVQFLAIFSSRSAKEISKLDSTIKERIRKRIERLEDDPFPQEVTRVEDYKEEKVYRIRIGDLRVLYTVSYNPQEILIIKIDRRERVYD